MKKSIELTSKEIALLLAKRRFDSQFPIDDRIDPIIGIERATEVLDRLKLDELRQPSETAQA